MHIGTKNSSKTECVFFPPPGFFNTKTLTLTDPTNSNLVLQKNKARKRDAHMRAKNIPSTKKQWSSKWKDYLSPLTSTSSNWGAKSHTLYEMITTLAHTYQKGTHQCKLPTNFGQMPESTTASITSSFSPSPSIYSYGDVRDGRFVYPS